MRLVVDLETDGLLQEVTKIHCAIVQDVDSSYSELFVGEDRVKELLKTLHTKSSDLIFHNGFNFDLLVLKKLYNWHPLANQKIHDTYILSQLLYSDLWNSDENNSHGAIGKVFSKRDYGSHSLKAWGQRLHCFKGDYTGGWESYNDDMGAYCIKDGQTTATLFKFLESKVHDFLLNTNAIDLEYSIAPILARQQNHGVLFDKEKAQELISTLTAKLVDLKWKLQNVFKPKFVSIGEFTPKRGDKSKGYLAGHTFTKIQLQEFNPNSRIQIVDRLVAEWNWNPEEFTEKGNAKMNEDIIDSLPFKDLEPLKEYLTITKRISQIETGTQAWLSKIDKDGRIRGAIRQNGAVTGRMAHFSPNMAQVPSNNSLYGKECRELFIAPKGKVLVGCDADSLEMRNLAGYLTKLDGGRFRESILNGKKELGTDAHTINQMAMQLPDRDCGKTIFYGYVYGAKNAKIGKILLDFGVNLEDYTPDFHKNVDGMVNWAAKKGMTKTRKYWECWVAGKHCIELFGDKLPELPLLKQNIKNKIDEVGYVKGLDGRKLFCRAEHGQLNTVLQSAGAVIMKKALFIADNTLQEKGLIPGTDYEFILNIHDEFEVECLDNSYTVGIISNTLKESISKAGEHFNFPCPMSGNVKVGKNWSEVH